MFEKISYNKNMTNSLFIFSSDLFPGIDQYYITIIIHHYIQYPTVFPALIDTVLTTKEKHLIVVRRTNILAMPTGMTHTCYVMSFPQKYTSFC